MNSEKSEKKKKSRSPLIAAGVILLLLIIGLMITLAFMSGTDEVTNAFGAGKVDIALTETNWSPAAASNGPGRSISAAHIPPPTAAPG